MTRASSGRKNQPPSHKKPVSGKKDATYNRGDAGKRRKPPAAKRGKVRDIDGNS